MYTLFSSITNYDKKYLIKKIPYNKYLKNYLDEINYLIEIWPNSFKSFLNLLFSDNIGEKLKCIRIIIETSKARSIKSWYLKEECLYQKVTKLGQTSWAMPIKEEEEEEKKL